MSYREALDPYSSDDEAYYSDYTQNEIDNNHDYYHGDVCVNIDIPIRALIGESYSYKNVVFEVQFESDEQADNSEDIDYADMFEYLQQYISQKHPGYTIYEKITKIFS